MKLVLAFDEADAGRRLALGLEQRETRTVQDPAPILVTGLARRGERLFDTVTSVRTSDEDLERARRSLVMLSPGQPSGWSREEVVRLIEDLQRCRYRGREVLAALQEIGAIAGRFLSHPTRGRSDVGRPRREPRAGN